MSSSTVLPLLVDANSYIAFQFEGFLTTLNGVKALKPPCLIVASQILPAMRTIISREMIERGRLGPGEAAARMGVTPAAVTQYLKGVRGSDSVNIVNKSRRAKKILLELAYELAREETDMVIVLRKLCEACNCIRSERLICGMCQNSLPRLDSRKCDICAT